MSDTKSKSLFHDGDDEFRSAADRPDPVIWVRRIVVVKSPRPESKPLRDVEMRRGLNIIATASPNEGDGPVGHNVGKTLFTRLIRYCLGESQFARSRVRESIRRILPEAYVVAEVFVAGHWWVVTRPIGEIESSDSWCLPAEHWQQAFENPTAALRYAQFIDAISQATVAGFSETLLPHQNRAVRWLDLLAWLSRDQFCRYRDPLEWRTAATESGTGELHAEDASILIRLVMDLLDDEERALIVRHRELLEQKTAQAAVVRDIEQDVATTRRFLQQRLRVADELLTDDLFGRRAHERGRIKARRLRSQIESLPNESGWTTLADHLRNARDAVTRAQKEFDLRQADRQILEAELQSNQTASDEDFEASFGDLMNPCPLPPGDCPLKDQAHGPGQRNPLRDALINQHTAELQALDQLLAELGSQLTTAITAHQDAERQHAEREQAVLKAQRRLSRRLARIDAITKEASGFVTTVSELTRQAGLLADLERRLRESRESQRAARELVARKQQTLGQHFKRVLARLLGPTFEGRIEISMKGLHLIIDDQDSLPGEAMATSGTVHSLDLACLRASIAGLGFMPRFLIHDSPREGDLEPHIYARLFRFGAELHRAFRDAEPSFQYIVATTTPPPSDIARDGYVCLTLDAREPGGLLLKQRF